LSRDASRFWPYEDVLLALLGDAGGFPYRPLLVLGDADTVFSEEVLALSEPAASAAVSVEGNGGAGGGGIVCDPPSSTYHQTPYHTLHTNP